MPPLLGKIKEKHGKGAAILKIYYICEYCERVFQQIEVEGGDGSIPIKGICNECALDMGLDSSPPITQHYYN